MKKKSSIWILIGILLAVIAAAVAVVFWLRKRAEKAAAEEFDAQTDAAEPETAQAQTA